jgi:cellobiose transport system substrate-binding protein
MELSRRQLMIRAGLLGVAGLTAGGTAACGTSSGATSSAKALSLWYWSGGLSTNVVADAVKRFKPQAKLTPSVIGGDFKQRLLTTLNARHFVPDITGVKGEDMPSMLPHADLFIDLNTLGAKKYAAEYLTWKWNEGTTQDGKLIGFPIDIGPTGLFYREDIFAKVGLPTDPASVSAAVKTWDGYFALGTEIHKAMPKTFLVNNISSVFSIATAQITAGFIDSSGNFTGDSEPIRAAWDTAVKPVKLGIDAKINDNSWNSAIGNGTLATEIGAAWHALDIESAAPQDKGKWRVASNPGGPGDIGGSFLAIPTECADPALAFEIVTWILSPANAARGFTDAALFPSSPATYAMPALTSGDPYFGGQKTIDIFGPSAKGIPNQYQAPADAAVSAPYYDQLTNVENGKSPGAAWADAVSQAKQIFQQQQAG